MKNNVVAAIVIGAVVILGVGYVERHQIKSMLMGPSATPTEAMGQNSPTPSNTENNVANTRTDAKKGSYLAAANGMTLYVFDKDTAGVSNCNGGCASVWPPYTVSGTVPATLPANVTTIKRADGSMQYAWKNMPLYFYQPDKQPGDLLGDGVMGIWHIVKP